MSNSLLENAVCPKLSVPEKLFLVREARHYWNSLFADTICGVELPINHQKSQMLGNYEIISFNLSSELVDRMSHFGGTHRSVLFILLITALEKIISRSGVDIKRVLPIGGFSGMGGNLILYPLEVAPSNSFRSQFSRNKEKLAKVLSYRFYPLQNIIETLPIDGENLFNVVMLCQQKDRSLPGWLCDKNQNSLVINLNVSGAGIDISYISCYTPEMIGAFHNDLMTALQWGCDHADETSIKPQANANTLLEEVLRIFRSALSRENIGADDNFFEIGGTSLSSTQVEVELEKRGFGEVNLFTCYTARRVVEYLNRNDPASNTGIKGETKPSAGDVEESIDKLSPFNDFFYRSCFYNSLFSMLQSCGRSIVPVLLNDSFFMIPCSGSLVGFTLKYEEKKPLAQILANLNVGLESRKQVDDIISYAASFLEQGKFLIIFIDTFYESIRADKYQLYHDPHTLLLDRYLRQKKSFIIIEHERWDQLNYQVRRLDEDTLARCYKGYLANINQEPYTVYEFTARSEAYDIHFDELHESFERYMLTESQNFYNNSKRLIDLAVILSNISALGLAKNENFITVVEFLSALINYRYMLRYLLKIFRPEDRAIGEAATALVRSWNSLRKHFFRMQILGKVPPHQGDRIASDLQSLSVEEQHLLDLIYHP